LVDLNDNRKTSLQVQESVDNSSMNLGKKLFKNEKFVFNFITTAVSNFVKFEEKQKVKVYLGLLGMNSLSIGKVLVLSPSSNFNLGLVLVVDFIPPPPPHLTLP